MSKEEDFAKLFRVDGHQVLFFIERDSEDEREGDYYVLNQMVAVDGIFANISGRGIPEDKIQKAFDGITEEHAKEILGAVREMLNSGKEVPSKTVTSLNETP